MQLLLIGLGGALGTMARHLVNVSAAHYLPSDLPFGRLFVNLAGCLFFGIVVGLAQGRVVTGTLTTMLLVGVLGGFTTFSAFSFDTLELLRQGRYVLGVSNVVGQVAGGLFALWCGLTLTRGL